MDDGSGQGLLGWPVIAGVCGMAGGVRLAYCEAWGFGRWWGGLESVSGVWDVRRESPRRG